MHQTYISPYYREDGQNHQYDESYLYTVSSGISSGRQSKTIQINIAGQPTNLMIDSGAEVNVILQKFVPPHVKIAPTTVTLHPYGSVPIQPIGEFVAVASWGSVQIPARWIVLNNNALTGRAVNILSCSTAEDLGILTINRTPKLVAALDNEPLIDPTTSTVLEQYPDVFTGLGKMKADPVTLYVKADTKPVIQPPRPIPFHLQNDFNIEIQQMEDDGVIEDHVGPVTWLSNPVLVPKPTGGLRITVDLRQLNKAIENTHLPIPRVERRYSPN